jgi:hypothetical protein
MLKIYQKYVYATNSVAILKLVLYKTVEYNHPLTSVSKHLGHSWGARWRSWLRHCATSIPDGVIGIFR